MQEKDIQTFIKGVQEYFREYAGEEVRVEIPYVKGSDRVLLDYTGAIGISGERKGCVYFTASGEMLDTLFRHITKAEGSTPSDLKDIGGEIANTVSGNARKHFGDAFMISIPMLLNGDASKFDFDMASVSYVFPIQWRGYKAFLVVGFENA